MKAIFPSVIDGDLLKLVYLSNGFKLVIGTRPFQSGNVCKTKARITSVGNTDAGKVVKVKGYVYRAGVAAIELVSSFHYLGRS
jgi:fatty acid synthase subunit alpha, fungi type